MAEYSPIALQNGCIIIVFERLSELVRYERN